MMFQVFDILMGEGGKELVTRLQRNTMWFRERMTSAGFNIKVCCMMSDNQLLLVYVSS